MPAFAVSALERGHGKAEVLSNPLENLRRILKIIRTPKITPREHFSWEKLSEFLNAGELSNG